MKKLLISILCLGAIQAYAVESGITPATSTTPPTNPQQLNNPTVGSRQSGSEQIFGEPKLTPKKQNQPKTANQVDANNPDVGGRQASSEQIFGQPKITGVAGKQPNKSVSGKNETNNPDVGGRQSGSEQLFGQSASPINNTQNSK